MGCGDNASIKLTVPVQVDENGYVQSLGEAVDLLGYRSVTATLTILEASGGGTLTVSLLTAPVNQTLYYGSDGDLTEFTATASGSKTEVFVDKISRFLMFKASISGGSTPTFTVEINLVCR